MSRLLSMKADGIDPSLPDLLAPGIVDMLMEIGPTITGSMGQAPIEWRDIAAWQEITGITLPPWQASMLRRLSRDYLAESQEATKPDRPAPYAPEDATEANRDAVASKVRGIFGGRARS